MRETPNLIIQRQDQANKKLGGHFTGMAPSELGVLSKGLSGLTHPNQVRKSPSWKPFSYHLTCSNHTASLLHVYGQPPILSDQADQAIEEEEYWVSLHVDSYLPVTISPYTLLSRSTTVRLIKMAVSPL